MLNPLIFREYDIRGRVEQDLAPENLQRLGQAMGAYFSRHNCQRLVLGQDCRLSSPAVADQITAALAASGCQVIDIGVCPTPVLYFAVRHLGADGGIMVTASHNPPEFNGFKICKGYHTIFGAEIQKLRHLAVAGEIVHGAGAVTRQEIIPAYKNYLRTHLTINRPVKVGMDGGHGTAGPIAVSLFSDMGCEVYPLYCNMDGSFPAHLPDPTIPAHLVALQNLVRERGLELGVAYDGDGDRLGVVDSQGSIIWGDELLVIFAREILKNRPGATIIGEVKCSQRLYDDIARQGGRGLMWKTGHSLIKQKMLEEEALLAGEMSGHIFFADRYFGFDDAIYATGRLLEILAATPLSLADLLADLPAAAVTPEIRWECPDDKKFAVVEALKPRLSGFSYSDLDGIRVQFPDGWGLVRASNTQPALVLRFEAPERRRLEEMQAFITGLLSETLATLGVERAYADH